MARGAVFFVPFLGCYAWVFLVEFFSLAALFLRLEASVAACFLVVVVLAK